MNYCGRAVLALNCVLASAESRRGRPLNSVVRRHQKMDSDELHEIEAMRLRLEQELDALSSGDRTKVVARLSGMFVDVGDTLSNEDRDLLKLYAEGGADIRGLESHFGDRFTRALFPGKGNGDV